MRARAWFPAAVTAACVAASAAACGSDATPQPPLPPVEKPIEYVNPFIGTGGFGFAHGSCFPGALAPNGLVKVGPDTKGPFGTVNFLHYSGYYWADDRIQGFSHLHLHGTGATDYGVLTVMPLDEFTPDRTIADGYESRFAKASETASPGSYAVTLDRGGIRVELTATTRAAHHRYTYPASATTAHLVFDLDKHLDSGRVADAEVTLDPATATARGRLRSIGGMSGGFGGYDVFFVARTKQAWTGQEVWSGGGAPQPGTQIAGEKVGFTVAVAIDAGAPVELQVGLSFVSLEDAEANLLAEMPGWDFDAAREATAAAWHARLATILVEGGTAVERRIFYSALYHAFLMPTVTSDVDGSFRYGGQVAQADGWRFLSDMSLWDTYRTLHPLYVLVAPDLARESAISLTEMAKLGGYFPKWPIATGESGVMLGSSAEIVLADAYVKGVTDWDAETAYAIARAAAMDPQPPAGGRGGRHHVDEYLTLHYVPATVGRSVSMTTEYAHDDAALANLAEALGHDADAAALRERSRGYRKLFDPTTGFLRGRYADGTLAIPDGEFDATAWNDDYAEANAWHSVWMAPHDVDGLADLFGGPEPFVAKLTEFFERAKDDWDATIDSESARALPRTWYWHGNEPDIHAVYLFAQIGRPDLTQKWARWIMANLYSDGPDGLQGNDDGGTLSSWYVFSALGLYPVPGTDIYVLGAPIFTRARIVVPGGELVIEAPDAGGDRIYVKGVTLDGVPLERAELRHGDLGPGRVLRFELSATPTNWGRRQDSEGRGLRDPSRGASRRGARLRMTEAA